MDHLEEELLDHLEEGSLPQIRTQPNTPVHLELPELTENAQKGSLVDCQEDVPYTALTIA